MDIQLFKKRPDCDECHSEAVITLSLGVGSNYRFLSLCKACAEELQEKLEEALKEI